MRKKLFKDLLLFLIFISKGKWNWYQLERELELRGLGGKVRVTDIIDQLVKEGFVYKKIDPVFGSGIPCYLITNKGEEKVYSLISQFGSDAFLRKQEDINEYE